MPALPKLRGQPIDAIQFRLFWGTIEREAMHRFQQTQHPQRWPIYAMGLGGWGGNSCRGCVRQRRQLALAYRVGGKWLFRFRRWFCPKYRQEWPIRGYWQFCPDRLPCQAWCSVLDVQPTESLRGAIA